MKTKKFFQAVLMALTLFVLMMGGQTVFAESDAGSLTIRRAASASEFTLYQVGTIDAQGNVKISPDFSKYAVNIDLSNEATMGRTAMTLASYIAQDQPDAYAMETADVDGTVNFTDLERGLYLAIGQTVIVDGTGYIQNPIMTAIPITDLDGNVRNHVEAIVKATTFKERTNYSVYKVWNDGSEDKRPEEIDVNLLQDGEIYDTVVLSEDNEWQYKWTGLAKGHVYTVTEIDVAAGYTVEISQNEGVFTITNNGKTKITPTPTPGLSGTPSITPGTPGIPQTGQLWWPVSWLAAAGIICLIVGLFVRNQKKKEND